jgi:hypothetical protein
MNRHGKAIKGWVPGRHSAEASTRWLAGCQGAARARLKDEWVHPTRHIQIEYSMILELPMHRLGVRQICPFGAHVIDLAAPPLRPVVGGGGAVSHGRR